MNLPIKNPWQDTSATLAEVEAELGADHVAYVRSLPHPRGTCAGRAAGAWDANMAEEYRAYRSLARILESEGIPS